MNVLKIFKRLFWRKKKVSKPYIERDTYCDLCKYADACDSRMKITILNDTRSHYIPMRGALCKAMEMDE